MTFSDLVILARTKGLDSTDAPRTQQEIAEACGISRAHLYSLLRGKHYPRPHIRERIARGLAELCETRVDRIRRTLVEEWEL